jgi:hypothetical protein
MNSSATQRSRPKFSSACEACKRRKCRCEMVRADGCHRCRILGGTCSLAESRLSPGRPASRPDTPYDERGPPSTDASTLLQIQADIRAVAERTLQIEQKVNAVRPAPRQDGPSRPWHEPVQTASVAAGTDGDGIMHDCESAVLLSNRALSLARLKGLPDRLGPVRLDESVWKAMHVR